MAPSAARVSLGCRGSAMPAYGMQPDCRCLPGSLPCRYCPSQAFQTRLSDWRPFFVGELMRKVAFLGALALVMALISLGPGPVRATVRAQHVNSVGGLDCNGFSLIQKPVRRGMLCTEIAANSEYGFKDNGHYIGHDEPAAE